MPAEPFQPDDLASALPDIPRWVEVRGMLLSGRGRILQLDTRSPLSAVVRQDDTGLAAVLGCPPASCIVEGASRAKELLVAREDADWVAAALPEWHRERAVLHQLATDATLPHVPRGAVRDLRLEELGQIVGLDETLRSELTVELHAGTTVAAALDGGRPVAFCYAGAATERWWDIAIDTLEPFRRQGHATRCVTYQIRRQAGAGRYPVWGAMLSNAPSKRMAERLGFVAVDSIEVFSRPET